MTETADTGVGSEQRHFEFLKQGVFRVQKCGACGSHLFPPREFCPACDELSPAWAEVTGLGTVYSYTVIGRKPEQGGDYNVVLVDLDEGVRLMSTALGLAPGELAVGLRLQAEVETGEQGGRVVFRRAA